MRGIVCFLLLTLLASCAPPSSLPGPPPNLAERDIGGTGSPSGALTAERGIGGTGIGGVITGFGSIFVDGFEVHYEAATPVTVDGAPASPAAFRKGQVVAVTAEGPTSAPRAERVSIIHEVAGPVEAIEDGGRVVRVADQKVVILAKMPEVASSDRLARGA